MFIEKFRAVTSFAFALFVLCALLWLSFWVAAGLIVALGIYFIARTITDTRPLNFGLR